MATQKQVFTRKSGSGRCGWCSSTGSEYGSQWEAIGSIAEKIGCSAETLRKWVRQAEIDSGRRGGLTSDERQRLKDLERENPRAAARERDPAQGVRLFRTGGARPPTEVMVTLHRRSPRGVRGRADLQGAADRPVDYYEQKARQADPRRLPARLARDAELRVRSSGSGRRTSRSTARGRSGSS